MIHSDFRVTVLVCEHIRQTLYSALLKPIEIQIE